MDYDTFLAEVERTRIVDCRESIFCRTEVCGAQASRWLRPGNQSESLYKHPRRIGSLVSLLSWVHCSSTCQES